MKLVYLGTSGAMPTVNRGLSCTVLTLDHQYIMVDCGDGACRQYVKSSTECKGGGLKFNKPMTILITHMHSDHTMGILGLLQSMDLVGRNQPITIYGVKGIKRFVETVNRSVNFKLAFDFNVIEVEHGDRIDLPNGVVVDCQRTKHQVPSLAYKITLPDKEGSLDVDKAISLGAKPNSEELGMLKRGIDIIVDDAKGIVIKSKDVVGEPTKGKVIGFSGDTRPIPELIPFFKDADFVTFETTFRSDELELAKKAKHSTAKEVGELLSKAGVKHILANHFSARHADVSGFKTDIKEYYDGKVTLTKDFLEVELD